MDTSRATATIDWLSYTIHWNTEALHRFTNGGSFEQISTALTGHVGAWLPQPPSRFYPYNYAAAAHSGLRVSISEAGSATGVHCSFSGSTLAQMNPRAILRQALAMGASITRIDIAIDWYKRLNLPYMKYELDAGLGVTRAQDWPLIDGRKGCTLYVGSRTSEKCLRIYDKAAEQNVEGIWYRIELECKGDFANGVARHVDANGYDYFGDIIRGFCDWPDNPAWQEATTSPTLLEGIPRTEKTRDTYGWLMSAAAPSLAKVLLDDHEKFVAFLRKVYTIAGVGDGVGESDPFDGQADWEPRPRH